MTPAFAALERCLGICDPGEKCAAVGRLWGDVEAGRADWDSDHAVPPMGEPGRPARPVLVPPAELPRRGLGSAEGRAALVHAVAHIEFNAINLALDAALRFRGLPSAYYYDWVSVAVDEARHFRMVQARLAGLGVAYGDLPAHDGLWEMALATAGSCLERMALVPRVLEARGLDVTPGMIERLRQAGDADTVAVLEVILAEEVRHVEIGSRWFAHCCREEGLDPERTFLDLVAERLGERHGGPINREARRRAGFTERELRALAAQ